MKLAVLCAGPVGGTSGTAWQRGGHDIRYGVRNPDDPKYGPLGAVSNAEAVDGADVVVLCTPWHGTREAVATRGDLAGKVLIDCTNPLTPDVTALEVGRRTGRGLGDRCPGVQGLNQIGAPMMDAPAFPGTPVMFICGDDDDAKTTTASLVGELGFETFAAGDLTLARLLEPFGMLWIHLALRRGFGTNRGFGLLRGDT